MDTKDCALILKVIARGSITGGGRDLGLSPATASARIAALEDRLGLRLLDRTTRQVTPTEAGRRFAERAQVITREVDALEADLARESDSPTGELKISSNIFFGRKHVLPRLRDFMDLYPDVSLNFDFSDRSVDVIGEGFDLAIRIGPLTASNLIAVKLAENHRVLCASPDYIARFGAPHHPRDLAAHRCLVQDYLSVWSFDGPDGRHSLKPESVIRHSTGEISRDAAIYGLGLALKTTTDIHQELADGRLVAVMTDYEVANAGAIWALHPSNRLVPPKLRVFLDFLKAQFRGAPYWRA